MEENQKTKLLIASDSTLPRLDGISIFLMNIVPRLKKDFSITILAPRFEQKTAPSDMAGKHFFGIRNVYTKTSRFLAGDFPIPIPSLRKIKEEVRRSDIVFVQSIGPIGLLAIRYAQKYGKKVITFIHSVEFELWMKSIKNNLLRRFTRRLAKKMMRFAYRRSDFLLIPTAELRGILEGQKIKTKMQVVHVGVDTKRYKPIEDKNYAKKQLKLYKKTIIGYVGRIAREKDLGTLIAAFEYLEKTRPDLVLMIVGTGLEEKLKRTVKSKNIIFTGAKEDVLPYLQAMDIFVMPSLTETSSLSTLEAMSCAIPVVVTPVGLLKDIIVRGENGFLFPKGSVDSLIEILSKLIKNPLLRERAGSRARTTIRQNFDWDKTAEQIKQVLRRV